MDKLPTQLQPDAALAAMPGGARTILVTGGTGFVGRRLVEALDAAGNSVIVLSRRPARAVMPQGVRCVRSLDEIGDEARIDAIVNLAGEPISNGLWTAAKRRRIIDSRVAAAESCLRLAARMTTPPQVIVSASAIGWYGIRGDEELDETSSGSDCFSRQVCLAIEDSAARAEALGLRSVQLRIGLVLGRPGGLLGRLLVPFRLGLGGRFGSGRHWMSWIHRSDLVRLICHCIANPAISGPVNATAPVPVRNSEFTRSLGRALRRPTPFPIPAWPLRLVLGQFADELLLGGQRVLPVKAQASGFQFAYPDLDRALSDIVGRK